MDLKFSFFTYILYTRIDDRPALCVDGCPRCIETTLNIYILALAIVELGLHHGFIAWFMIMSVTCL